MTRVCDLQLKEKLETLERVKADQNESLEALRVNEQAFSGRFRALFRQTIERLESLQAGQQREDGIGWRDRLKTFEDEAQRGDVVRMVQLLPALLEDVITAQSGVRPAGNNNAARVRGWKRKTC